jgi:hypothetical protein
MRRALVRLLTMTLALDLVCAAAIARADTPAPLRHLVYSFTYEARQSGTVPNEPGSTGNRSYNGSLDDKGTITVDVLREAPDRGLVVVVSEQGDYRKGAAATCAVYGNTEVVCDPSVTVNSEEATLLRFLGANFYDPSSVDAKQHWSVSHSSGTITASADYTISRNDNGVMTIEESRHVEDKSQGVTTSDAETKIDYDDNRLLPTLIDEYTTEQRHTGALGNATTIYQTTLTLVSDSMTKQ